MKVKIKKLNELAKTPIKFHEEDFAYDVYATSCEEVEPGIWKYGIGLAFEIVRDTLSLGVEEVKIGSVCYEVDENGNLISTDCTIQKDTSLTHAQYSNVKLSLDFRPRSSIWQTGMVLSNCVGTIDELYRGEVMAYFYEVIKGKEKYKVGDRIGQIKLGFTLPIEFEECGDINLNTSRGVNGFGSTKR